MKKLILMLISLLLVFSLCSCDALEAAGDLALTVLKTVVDHIRYEEIITLTPENYQDYVSITTRWDYSEDYSKMLVNYKLFNNLDLRSTPVGKNDVVMAKNPKIIVEATPLEDDYEFDYSTITLTVGYYIRDFHTSQPYALGLDDYHTAQVTVCIGKSATPYPNSRMDPFLYIAGGGDIVSVDSVDGKCYIPCVHDYSDQATTTVTVATCTEEGSASVTCKRCDHKKEIKTDAWGHEEISHEAQNPTCEAHGWNSYVTCARCDYTTYSEKKALGHDTNSVIIKEATTTEAGLEKITCSRCNYYEEKEIPIRDS